MEGTTSGTERLMWYMVDGIGDAWYVVDRRDNGIVCGCKAASIANALAYYLNDGWSFEKALMKLAGVWQTR